MQRTPRFRLCSMADVSGAGSLIRNVRRFETRMKPTKHLVLTAVLAALVFAAATAVFTFDRISKRNDGFRRDANKIVEALYWLRADFSARYPDERQFVAALLSEYPTASEL